MRALYSTEGWEGDGLVTLGAFRESELIARVEHKRSCDIKGSFSLVEDLDEVGQVEDWHYLELSVATEKKEKDQVEQGWYRQLVGRFF